MNYCDDSGAGAYLQESNAQFNRCNFSDNTSSRGGGISFHSSTVTIDNSTISNNYAFGVRGGGVYCDANSTLYLNSCDVSSNTAHNDGGGLYCDLNTQTTISDCFFYDNVAKINGGGIYNYTSSNALITTNTTFCNNTPNHIYGTWTDNGKNSFSDDCNACPDTNSDSKIDVKDILIILDFWGCTDCSQVDVSQDGIVNLNDIILVLGNWGACP